MRENLTQPNYATCIFLRFSSKTTGGTAIAKEIVDRVDSVDGIGRVRGLFAKTKLKPAILL
jgi:hypothetical protein